MSNPWFRFHRKAVHDYTVQSLDPILFKAWVNLMCLSDDNGRLPSVEEVSFAFHETKEAVSSAFHELEKVALLVTDGETFHIAKWDKKQYKSDTSTERVKRYRERQRNVSETPQIQNRTEADTEQKDPPKPPQGGAMMNGSKRLRKRDSISWEECGRMIEDGEI
ncbi:MAG: hypothetical protein KAV87_31405 [Desulfobacteraceae bacterium]|nr:hypothetical protein [Desulfobacteraceae bacterium]